MEFVLGNICFYCCVGEVGVIIYFLVYDVDCGGDLLQCFDFLCLVVVENIKGYNFICLDSFVVVG